MLFIPKIWIRFEISPLNKFEKSIKLLVSEDLFVLEDLDFFLFGDGLSEDFAVSEDFLPMSDNCLTSGNLQLLTFCFCFVLSENLFVVLHVLPSLFLPECTLEPTEGTGNVPCLMFYGSEKESEKPEKDLSSSEDERDKSQFDKKPT